MTHTHSHQPGSVKPASRTLVTVLALAVAAILVAAIAAMVVLWPNPTDVPRKTNPYGADGVSTVDGTVTNIKPFDCGSGNGDPSEGLNGQPSVAGPCAHIVAEVDEGNAAFDLDSARFKAGIDVGDDVKLVRIEPKGQEASFEFLDFKRSLPLTALALAFAFVVVLVARWRGFFAIVGIGITMLALTKFVVPALLAGEPGLLVAITGSTVIMVVVLYLAHGVSIRTTSALFGTLAGIVLTAVLGLAATQWSHLTGVSSEDDFILLATAPDLKFSSVVAATMVIAGLGVLNDVTVTQASAVWEMRALQPSASRAATFTSAMRIGRDHIASSVYTLVFAYAGTAMTVLLLITAYQRGLAEIATTEQVGQEIARTFVGAIGLVLAVPITTLIAVYLAPTEPVDNAVPAPVPPGRRRALRGRD